jgi:hypothetical protein
LISTFAADAAAPGGVPPAELALFGALELPLGGVPLAEPVPPGDPAVEAVGAGDFPGAVGEDGFEGAAAISAFESTGFSPLAPGWLLATTPGAGSTGLVPGVAGSEASDAADAGGLAGDADAAPSDDFMFMARGEASAAGFLSSEEAMACRLAGPVSGVARWATAYHSAHEAANTATVQAPSSHGRQRPPAT